MEHPAAALRGAAVVRLSGEDRTLRLDFNALIAAESVTGKDYADPDTWYSYDASKPETERVKMRLHASDYRALIWAALGQQPSLEEVGSWLVPSDDDTAKALTAIVDLWFGQMRKRIDDEETKGLPLANAGSDDGQ